MSRIVFSLWALCSVALLASCSQEKSPEFHVILEDVELSLDVTGELMSSDSVKIGAPLVKNTWQYKLIDIAKEGSSVKKGDVVARFDEQQLQRKLQKSMASLNAEKKSLESKTLDSEKLMEDLKLSLSENQMQLKKAQRKASQDGSYAAKMDVKRLVVELKIAKQELLLEKSRLENNKKSTDLDKTIIESEIDRLSAEVQSHKESIKKMQVTAEKDGVVVYLKDYQGNKKAVGDSVFMSQKIMEIPNLNMMQVKTTVPEHQVSELKLGQKVKVSLDALPDRVFKGHLLKLGRIVRVKARDDQSMVYDAVVSLDDVDPDVMRPGMAARLSVVQAPVKNAALIPKRLIRYQQGQPYVEVSSMFGKRKKFIQISGFKEERAVVGQGLSGGERLL